MIDFEKARALLHEFKGDSYLFGANVLPRVGEQTAAASGRADCRRREESCACS